MERRKSQTSLTETFNISGVNFCSLFYIRYKSQRKGTYHKVYVCVFIYIYIFNFCALVLEIQCAQNFGDIKTDRHFLKMASSSSGHLKACKSIENRMSKIFTNPILSSYVFRHSTNFLPKETF